MGARGVLAATMLDVHAVVDSMLSDLRQQEQCPQEVQTTAVPSSPPTPKSDVSLSLDLNPRASLEDILPPVLDGLMSGCVMDYASWKRVDAEEIRRGRAQNQNRGPSGRRGERVDVDKEGGD